MFTIYDAVAPARVLFYEDMITIARLANGVKRGVYTAETLDDQIREWWPLPENRVYGTIRLMINTIASQMR